MLINGIFLYWRLVCCALLAYRWVIPPSRIKLLSCAKTEEQLHPVCDQSRMAGDHKTNLEPIKPVYLKDSWRRRVRNSNKRPWSKNLRLPLYFEMITRPRWPSARSWNPSVELFGLPLAPFLNRKTYLRYPAMLLVRANPINMTTASNNL